MSPQVTCFADAQNDRLHEAIESAQEMARRDLGEVPGPDRVLDGFQQRVLPDALRAAQHQRVIDFSLRDTVRGCASQRTMCPVIVRIDLGQMIEPRIDQTPVTVLDRWRPIEVETVRARALDPPSIATSLSVMIIGRPGAHVIW